MRLIKDELETLVNFSESNSQATVYTFNKKMKKKLDSLSKEHPDIFRLIRSDKFRSATYEIPKKCLSIRFIAPISEDERKRRREWAIKNKPLKKHSV